MGFTRARLRTALPLALSGVLLATGMTVSAHVALAGQLESPDHVKPAAEGVGQITTTPDAPASRARDAFAEPDAAADDEAPDSPSSPTPQDDTVVAPFGSAGQPP